MYLWFKSCVVLSLFGLKTGITSSFIQFTHLTLFHSLFASSLISGRGVCWLTVTTHNFPSIFLGSHLRLKTLVSFSVFSFLLVSASSCSVMSFQKILPPLAFSAALLSHWWVLSVSHISSSIVCPLESSLALGQIRFFWTCLFLLTTRWSVLQPQRVPHCLSESAASYTVRTFLKKRVIPFLRIVPLPWHFTHSSQLRYSSSNLTLPEKLHLVPPAWLCIHCKYECTLKA